MSEDDRMPDDPDSDRAAPMHLPVVRKMDRSAPVRRLERELSDGDRQIAIRVFEALKEEVDSANEDLESTVGTAIESQAATLRQLTKDSAKTSLDIHDLKRTDRTASRLAWGAPAVALAIAAYVAQSIWGGSEVLTTLRLELKYQAMTIERLRTEVDHLEHPDPKP